MSRFFVIPLVLLAGCVSNGVYQLSPATVAKSERAVLIYGIGVEGKWDAPRFGVQLTEYNVKEQVGKGNCLVFNRTEATVPSAPGPVQYFAFEVPAGHYAYSSFNGSRPPEPLAFLAVKGRATYVGDFIYTSRKDMELRRNSEGLERASRKFFPGVSGQLHLAEAVAAGPPMPFLCTP